jgi:hypothetical protein
MAKIISSMAGEEKKETAGTEDGGSNSTKKQN